MLTRRRTLTNLLGPAAAFGLAATLPARGQGAAVGNRTTRSKSRRSRPLF